MIYLGVFKRGSSFVRFISCLLTLLLLVPCIYVYADNGLSVDKGEITNRTGDGGKPTGVGLATWACAAYSEGWAYVYGGTSVGSVDCSGLICTYYGVGGERTNLLSSSSNSGSIESGVPRIHGLGLHRVGHVGIYLGGTVTLTKSLSGSGAWLGEQKTGNQIDASEERVGMKMRTLNSSTNDGGWTSWFKVKDVSYPEKGWVKFNNESYYYEKGEYVVSCTKKIDGAEYKFDANGVSNKAPAESAYSQTTYTVSSGDKSATSSNGSVPDTSTSSVASERGGAQVGQSYVQVSRDEFERSLSYEEQQRVEELNDAMVTRAELSIWSNIYTFSSFMGILVLVYSLLLLIAFYIDIFNSLSEMSLLQRLSFGSMYPVGSKTDSEFLGDLNKGDKVHYITHAGIWLSFAIGVMASAIFLNLRGIVEIVIQFSAWVSNLF